jgi:hypothetical protein
LKWRWLQPGRRHFFYIASSRQSKFNQFQIRRKYDGFEKIDKGALQIPGVRRFGILCSLSLQQRIRVAINLLRPMRATIQQLRCALSDMLSNLQCMHSTVRRRLRADELRHRLIPKSARFRTRREE